MSRATLSPKGIDSSIENIEDTTEVTEPFKTLYSRMLGGL